MISHDQFPSLIGGKRDCKYIHSRYLARLFASPHLYNSSIIINTFSVSCSGTVKVMGGNSIDLLNQPFIIFFISSPQPRLIKCAVWYHHKCALMVLLYHVPWQVYNRGHRGNRQRVGSGRSFMCRLKLHNLTCVRALANQNRITIRQVFNLALLLMYLSPGVKYRNNQYPARRKPRYGPISILVHFPSSYSLSAD